MYMCVEIYKKPTRFFDRCVGNRRMLVTIVHQKLTYNDFVLNLTITRFTDFY